MTATFNLADLFEQTAAAVPDRLALAAGPDLLTYRELDERSTRFAGWLRAQGVGPGDHVAVIGWNSTDSPSRCSACSRPEPPWST